MGQDGVVAVAAAGADHLPSRRPQLLEGAPVIVAGEQEIDVVHGAEPRRRVAGGHRGPLEDDWFQSGVGQGPHRQGHRAGDEQKGLHAERVGHATEHGAAGPDFVARTGGMERPPQQWADPVVGRGGDGSVEVGAAIEGTPDRFRIGIRAAGLPEQCGGGLGAGGCAAGVVSGPVTSSR